MSPFVLLLILAGTANATQQAGTWQENLEALKQRQHILFQRLEQTLSPLVVRAGQQAPELLERLTLEEPVKSGYGVLPEIEDDKPGKPVVPRQTVYALDWLGERIDRALSEAAVFSADVAAERDSPLEPLVVEFERLRKEHRYLETHLSYHSHWQGSVLEHLPYFEERNRLVALTREMQALIKSEGSADRVDALRSEIVENVSTFRATPGLIVTPRKNGTHVLPVTVCTDIGDDAFLKAFEDGVHAAFVDSPAARSRGFAVDLRLRRIPPDRLYPEGAPAPGAPIKVKAHRARFRDCPLVLTTGAESTHAWVGDVVLLGPGNSSRHVLAHEFAHLLGFSDAYIRGFDGKPGAPLGITLVEWTGLTDDLMGNPGHGRVSEKMIDQLLRAYGDVLATGSSPDALPGNQ